MKKNAYYPALLAISLSLVFTLAACSATKSGKGEVTVSAPAPAATVTQSVKSPAERFQAALELLQNGQAQQADEELHAYLRDVPDSKAAHGLVQQIETPLDKLFPAKNFPVKLAKDESLSSLAKTYLSDAMSFYALARYNAIPVPAKVNAGQTIKIPATPSALAAAKEANATGEEDKQLAVTPTPKPKRAASEVWKEIKADIHLHQYEEAVALADAENFKPDSKQAPIVAEAYAECAKAERENDQEKSSGCAINAGRLYLEAGNPAKAMDALEIALALSADNADAKALYQTASRKIADREYKQGMIAFQRQDLDGAIAAWDKVLALDPDHKDAQLNRAQALKLKENLKRLQH